MRSTGGGVASSRVDDEGARPWTKFLICGANNCSNKLDELGIRKEVSG